MVKILYTQRFPIGTRVSKYFNGFKEPFKGTVDEHSDMTDFYHVSYDDGDSEEMTEDDVETHFLKLPNVRRPIKTVKPQILELNKATTHLPTKKPYAKLQLKQVSSESSSSLVPPVTVSKTDRRQKPKVLSLNENAPGLVRGNSLTGQSGPSDKIQESFSVSIPTKSFKDKKKKLEVEEEEVEAEEEEEEEEEEVVVEDDDEGNSSLEGTPEEINQLIGKPVERTIAKDGTGLDVVRGAVASYFPATKMFRVMYFDGECSDLTYHDVLKSIPAMAISEKRKRKAKRTQQNQVKDGTSSALSTSPKRLKTIDSKADDTIVLKPTGSPSSSIPTIQVADMLTIDNVELNIVRKVLYIIVSTVNSSMMEMQLEALSSPDLKDKEALEVFVRKDGLITLAELLSKWENQVETEQGLLLVLKVLAVLPGITKHAIMTSGIGKKVRMAEKHGTYKNSSIPGLAAWVIQKMKADVSAVKKGHVQRKKTNQTSDGDRENRPQGSSTLRRSTSIRPCGDTKHDDHQADLESTVNPRLGNLKTSRGSEFGFKQSNSANHLHTLMNSRNRSETRTVSRGRDVLGNILTGQNHRRLGTAQNWRARRSTVVLDQVTKRVSESAQDVVILKTKAVADDSWRPSKISFAETDSVCPFDKEVEVSKLLVYRFSGSRKAPGRPVAKLQTGVLRSILRVRLPASQPRSNEFNVASPKVHATERPTLDPIVVPSQHLSLSVSDVVEDGTLESPMYISSRLSKVVSPTEKRKQGISSPPRIAGSEQPPRRSTKAKTEGEVFEMLADNMKADALVKNNEEVQPGAVMAATPALSPVVSEDESSEDSEASINGADDSAPEPVANFASCSTGSKKGGDSAMEASVQLATITSA